MIHLLEQIRLNKQKQIRLVERQICTHQYSYLENLVAIQKMIRKMYTGEVQQMEKRRTAVVPLLEKFNGDRAALTAWKAEGNWIGEKVKGFREKRSKLLANIYEAEETVQNLAAKQNGHSSPPTYEELSNITAEDRLVLITEWKTAEMIIRIWRAVFDSLKEEWDELNKMHDGEIQFLIQQTAEICKNSDIQQMTNNA
ncbi:unnamed protein product [Orchesella dallaii]|uniref:Uncharacterized protein n=1 Tax=Orchesella dallaii TaxID=48710 RepID=A0ABP1PV18_9HEXA